MADRRQGRRIAEIRERRGLSQEEVARRVGVSTSGYQKWELGGGIRGENLRRLADVLDVTLLTITGETEPPDPFSLAEHLDVQIDEFRRYVAELKESVSSVDARLVQVVGLLEAIVAGMPAATSPSELIETGAEAIERAAQARRAARGASAAGRASADDRPAG